MLPPTPVRGNEIKSLAIIAFLVPSLFMPQWIKVIYNILLF